MGDKPRLEQRALAGGMNKNLGQNQIWPQDAGLCRAQAPLVKYAGAKSLGKSPQTKDGSAAWDHPAKYPAPP